MNFRNLQTECALALRYLKPKRNAISVITAISLVGVMLGVAVLIVVLSVMTGFTALWKQKMLETTAHVQIQKELPDYFSRRQIEAIADPNALIERLKKVAPNVDFVAVTQSPILLQRKDSFEPMVMLGLENNDNKKILDLQNNLQSGTLSLEKNEIMVSDYVRTRLNLHVGSKLLLHSWRRLSKLINTDEEGNIALQEQPEVALPREFTVSGFFNFNLYEFDKNIVFVGLDDADELIELSLGSASLIYAWVPDPLNMQKEMDALSNELGPSFVLQSWEDTNGEFLAVLKTEKMMLFFLLFFIVLVAAFSIMNTLITVAIQKTREIGILKSLGATRGAVMRVFLFQGLAVGLFGSLAGLLAGVTVITYRNEILHFTSRIAGRNLFPPEYYNFGGLPAELVFSDIAIVLILSIVLCTLGAVVPAYRAASLDPAQALRYE